MPGLHFKITGHVNGVGFRYAMCRQARHLGLAGWVRNRTDGSVEAVAVGEKVRLQRLVQWAQRGPDPARVEDVQTRAATDSEAEDADDPFTQRSTA